MSFGTTLNTAFTRLTPNLTGKVGNGDQMGQVSNPCRSNNSMRNKLRAERLGKRHTATSVVYLSTRDCLTVIWAHHSNDQAAAWRVDCATRSATTGRPIKGYSVSRARVRRTACRRETLPPYATNVYRGQADRYEAVRLPLLVA